MIDSIVADNQGPGYDACYQLLNEQFANVSDVEYA